MRKYLEVAEWKSERLQEAGISFSSFLGHLLFSVDFVCRHGRVYYIVPC